MIVLNILLVLISVGLIALVVAQPSKGEGLGSIGGGGQMFFAKNKGLEKLLTKVTAWLAGAFFIIALVVGVLE
ncbi:MAG: preprotein translocase subunit SecG [Patescibacteria group bacterium]